MNVSCSHISGDFDLFFPLKNSGSARFSIEWMLENIDTKRFLGLKFRFGKSHDSNGEDYKQTLTKLFNAISVYLLTYCN